MTDQITSKTHLINTTHSFASRIVIDHNKKQESPVA